MVETTVDYAALEAQHSAGVFGPRGVTFVRGQGSTLWDEQGRAYLDCIAGYGTAPLGHSHPALVEAISRQAAELIACNSIFTNNQRSLLFDELAAVLPLGLDRFFLCNSGTEAIEGALKFARLATGKSGVVATMRGFHGRSMGALSATYEPHYRDPFKPLLEGFRHVPYNNLAALDEALAEDVGAVIFELVQGEGGVRPGNPDFLRGAQELCRQRGAMLIVDEVQTGFGRTGKLFAIEHYGLEPDLICLSKGMGGGVPIGAVVAGPRIPKIPVGAHGSTFGGNPLAAAAARATLRVLREEELPRQAAEKGAYLLDRLRSIESRKIREVRGLGLMVGVELRERVTPYLQALQERGVIALNASPMVIRLLPPLVISYEELDQAVEAIAAVLA